MQSLGSAGSGGQWSNIATRDKSRSHFGHVYNTVKLDLHYPEESEQNVKTKAIIERLHYPEIQHREKQIDDAAEGTFTWAFNNPSVPLRDWLIGDQSMFWVCGKPGSGKSTFMKCLSRHARTEKLLDERSEGRSLIVAAHYFWYAGTRSVLERSREGLYRSLLYQVLSSLPEAVSQLLPDRWQHCKFPVYVHSEWTIQELLKGLKLLPKISGTDFVFFIDGLDECHPSSEHGGLLTELEELSTLGNVKICVSSRPWKPFVPRLGLLKSRLTMQDLTSRDMEDFVIEELWKAAADAGLDIEPLVAYGSSDHLSSEHIAYAVGEVYDRSYFVNIGTARPLSTSNNRRSNNEKSAGVSLALRNLTRHIVWRSEGVFLWVRLVLIDIREEMFAGKSFGELEHFIDEMPSGLLDYYKEGIWKRIGWRKEQQIAMAFRIAAVLAPIDNRSDSMDGFFCFLHFWYIQQYKQSDLEDPPFAALAPIQIVSGKDIASMAKKTTAFLGQVCKDLIKVEDALDGAENPDLPRVEFLHRSVLDFLTDPETQVWIEKRVPPHFCRPGFIFELTLLRLKIIPSYYGIEEAERELWESLEFMGGVFKGRPHQLPGTPDPLHSMPKFRAGISDLEYGLVPEYEELAIQRLRARDVYGFLQLDDSENSLDSAEDYVYRLQLPYMARFVECFTSFGLTTLIREIAMRSPSTFSDDFQRNIFDVVRTYVVHKANKYITVEFVKDLLSVGTICSTESWRGLLHSWCDYMYDEETTRSWIWPVARTLISAGVNMKVEFCFTHPAYEACTMPDRSGCEMKTAADVLQDLVPQDLTFDLSKLLADYDSATWLCDVRRERRRASCALYRNGRKIYLQAARASRSWNLSDFELQYAEWVHRHDSMRLYSSGLRQVHIFGLSTSNYETCDTDAFHHQY